MLGNNSSGTMLGNNSSVVTSYSGLLGTTSEPKYYKRSNFSLTSILPFYIPITLICLIGNTLVCVTVFRNKRMKSRCYYILSNLAIADMGFALATPLQLLPFSGINPGTAGCKTCIFVIDIFFGSAVLSLAAVSIDRYRGICCSTFNRARDQAPILGHWLIPIIWLVAALIYLPMLVTCRENPDPNLIACDCYSMWPKKYHYTIYACFIVLCTYVIPLITMAFCYTKIFLTIRKSKHDAPVARGAPENRKKVIKMLVVATILFMLSWLLYNVLYLLKKFEVVPEKILGKLWLFSQVLGFANSACNPFVYCIFSKNFRRGFKDAFMCLRMRSFTKRDTREHSPLSEQRIFQHKRKETRSTDDTGYQSNGEGAVVL